MEIVLIGLLALVAIQGYEHRRSESKLQRAHLREREALINKIMHLAGRTWEPPPVENGWEPEARPNYTVSPEQDLDLN